MSDDRNIEERLERAMRAHVATVNPTEDWDDVEQRAEQIRRRGLRRRAGFGALGLAAAVLVIVGLISLTDDGDETTVAVTAPATTTTTETTTTTLAPATTTPPTVPVPVRPGNAIFPFDGERQFQDPSAAALAFAREYLGMPNAVVQSTNLSARAVDIRARGDRPLVTTVLVEQNGGAWYVTGARSDNIRLETGPSGLTRITSPVRVQGQSTAFEAQVNWEVRDDGQGFGQKLGEGFFMGGANGEFGPFDAQLTFDPPARSQGAIVLFTVSPEDGSVAEATVAHVTFG